MKYLKLFEGSRFKVIDSHGWKGKLCIHRDYSYLYLIEHLDVGYWNNGRERDPYFKQYQVWGVVFDYAKPAQLKLAGPHHFSIEDGEVFDTPQEMFDKHTIETLEIYDEFMKMENADTEEDYIMFKQFIDKFREIEDIDKKLQIYRQGIKYNL